MATKSALTPAAIVVDANGVIIMSNAMANQIFMHNDLVGQNAWKIIPEFTNTNKAECFRFNNKYGNKLAVCVPMEEPPVNSHKIILLFNSEEMMEFLSNQVTGGEKNNIDFLIDAMDNNATITDKHGVILRVSSSFSKTYGVKEEELIGKSVYELERQGLFSPSITALVLRDRKKITILQKNRFGESILVTAVPVINTENEIEYVFSFDAIDIANLASLQDKYDKLKQLMRRYSSELETLRRKEIQFPGIIAKSDEMKKVLSMAIKVAESDANILITGETGVGKNIVAKLIHQKSERASKSFIEVNCGAIPENLIESELFGYEKGSFTGAHHKGKVGLIELADEGTLFLDEIGELPLSLQTKLLKVLAEKTITRLGGTHFTKVDFRLIAATNKNLKKLVEEKLFREDLFYRLNVVPIHIPPLRERIEDILPLLTHFIKYFNDKYKRNKSLSEQAINALLQYHWPGNIRELENLIERLVLMTEEDVIGKLNLPDSIAIAPIPKSSCVNLKEALMQYEKQLIQHAYNKYGTSVGVSKALGISQPTAVRKLMKYIEGYKDRM